MFEDRNVQPGVKLGYDWQIVNKENVECSNVLLRLPLLPFPSHAASLLTYVHP